jgi:hypothetical protein
MYGHLPSVSFMVIKENQSSLKSIFNLNNGVSYRLTNDSK